jgi:hypothetical protein
LPKTKRRVQTANPHGGADGRGVPVARTDVNLRPRVNLTSSQTMRLAKRQLVPNRQITIPLRVRPHPKTYLEPSPHV